MIVSRENSGERLDRYLARVMPELSRARIQKLVKGGLVTINGKQTGASAKIREGDKIAVTVPEPEPMTAEPEDIPLDVVYEDADLIVVNKPAGMAAHPAAGRRAGTLVNALLNHCADLSGVGGVLRPGIVHRLDKDTSGLIVAAKNDAAHHSLSAQLKDRSLSRTYLAVVKNRPRQSEGTVEMNIGRHPQHRKKMAALRQGGRRAVTHYKIVQNLDTACVVEATLETGRTHQIRVAMLALNCPVMGDSVYGRAEKPRLIRRQALHAWKLSLAHPRGGERMSFTAPLPGDMATLIEKLGGDPAPFRQPRGRQKTGA